MTTDKHKFRLFKQALLNIKDRNLLYPSLANFHPKNCQETFLSAAQPTPLETYFFCFELPHDDAHLSMAYARWLWQKNNTRGRVQPLIVKLDRLMRERGKGRVEKTITDIVHLGRPQAPMWASNRERQEPAVLRRRYF